MMSMEHIEWLDRTLGNDSRRHAASLIGMPTRTFATQVKKGVLPAETVIAVSIAYDIHPVRALVDTGYLDEHWAQAVDPATALRQVSEDDLADEVLRRMKLPGAHDVFETPVSDLDEKRRAKETTPADTTADQSEQPETPPSVHDDDDDDGTVRPFDWEPGTYAADSSPDEDAGREEEGADPFP